MDTFLSLPTHSCGVLVRLLEDTRNTLLALNWNFITHCRFGGRPQKKASPLCNFTISYNLPSNLHYLILNFNWSRSLIYEIFSLGGISIDSSDFT